MEDRDGEELILVLCGYYKLLSERDLEVVQDNSILQQLQEQQQREQQELEEQQGKKGTLKEQKSKASVHIRF